MPLTRTQMDQMVEQHFGFEARDDIDVVLATLTPNVEHDIVGWPAGPAHDRAGARRFYEALFADLSDGREQCQRRLYGEDFVIDESVWRGTASGQPFGLAGRGRPLEFRMLHVLEFSGEGAIKRENVWVDLAAIQRQLPQS